MRPNDLKGSIEFKGVDFRYGTRELALKNISLNIHSGEKVAFVGESGSGKSTLIKLLMNFYSCEKGEILINGMRIQDIHIDSLRQRIAYIPQNTFFFSGTIVENLCLGITDDCDLERVTEVARIARAHDFIQRLPSGYNTLLEENGANLSGGQRQRLAIARAMLKDPDILIMDEATSNLDSATERSITEMISEVKGITTIVIAHRLSTIMRCDRICVMDNGQIVDCGSHQELIRKRGKYYDLWKDQMPGLLLQEEEQEANLVHVR